MSSNQVNQAVILSAGFGTRLRPLTNHLPKVMVPLLGKPLLEHHLNQFKRHGVNEFFINLHYLPEVIRNYFGDGRKWDVSIKYHLEPEILGTAGGLKNFEADLKDLFFVIYGDIFSLVNYSKMLEAFARRKDAVGMVVVGDTDHPHDSDLAEVDKAMRLVSLRPKPHQSFPLEGKAMKGCYIFRKDVLGLIPFGQYYEIDHDLLPALLARGKRLYGYETKDYLKDIGTPERLKEVESYLRRDG
jgi:mannose-1-phosphate guanylyltransferase